MNFRRSVIIAELWRPEVARLGKNVPFCVFFGTNDPLLGNFQNSVPKVFIATPIDVLCSHFVKFGQREIGKVVRDLTDKKTKFRVDLQLSLLPKSASPRQCTQSAPDFIQIGLLSAELYPNT